MKLSKHYFVYRGYWIFYLIQFQNFYFTNNENHREIQQSKWALQIFHSGTTCKGDWCEIQLVGFQRVSVQKIEYIYLIFIASWVYTEPT